MKNFCFALLIVCITVSIAWATTIARRKYKCFVCGAEHEYSVIQSTNAFGSSDLDLRPPEMQRSTMRFWVQECPSCGYAASKVSDSCDVPAEFLKSKEYISCEGITFTSDLAKRFYRQYMILRESKKLPGAFYAVLHAAWSCDDERNDKRRNDRRNSWKRGADAVLHRELHDSHSRGKNYAAILCREKAAALADELLKNAELTDSERETLMLMRADILRRAEHFEEVIRIYSDVKFSGENKDTMNAVLRFQLEKAQEKNTDCYTIMEALKNEQHNP